MLDFIRHEVSDRKLRLFALACVRRADTRPFTKHHWDVVLDVEVATEEGWDMPEPQWAVGNVLSRLVLTNAFRAAWATANQTQGTGGVEELEGRRAQCGLLRDIFGNPFRPVTADPNWLTSSVLALARQVYEARDFAPMPILADALQDAGCDNPDILAHCRGPGPHVRGCWVVDLLSGKA
jgi:hypothetical protein